MDSVISETCFEGPILQRNYRKISILWSFSFISFVKFKVKFGSHNRTMSLCYTRCYIQILIKMRYVIKGQLYIVHVFYFII